MGLAGQWLEDPAPILTQIIANQIHSLGVLATAGNSLAKGLANAFNPENSSSVPAILRKASEQIAAGQFEDGFLTAFSTVVMLGFPIMMAAGQVWPAISQPFKNLANLVDGSLFPLLMGVGLGMLVPFEPLLHVAGRTIEDAVSAVKAMDLVTLASTVINAPAALTGAFLNGYIDPQYHFLYPGLLSAPPGSTGSLSGILSAIGNLADLIKTPGTDRHDLGGALTGLAGIIGGIFGVSQANRSAPQDIAADTVLADGPAALPSASPKAITLSLDTGTALKAPAEKVVAEKVVVEAPAERAPVVEAPAEKAPVVEAPADTVTEKADSVVQISPKITVGKVGTAKANAELKQAADTVGKQLNSTAKKVSDGLKNGFAKTTKKTADSGASSGGGAGAGSSGSSE
ncbi:hypothetical protein [Mycolicibacterium frederiksbergense]|uniref:hypothetical protein n=1 Tax=Mycolicibacterium frederiksbergense TaxID=117567 RepID=UPI0024730014|nr:hypothetical protein [Mycolicibacterium frederiksbergense]